MDIRVRRLTGEEITKIYKTHMKRDFPPDELKPLSHILRSMEEGYGFSLGVYEKKSPHGGEEESPCGGEGESPCGGEGKGFCGGEEETLCGYGVFILCEETNCALLDYFAVLKDRRGEGLGHLAIDQFGQYLRGNLPQIEGLYIESERAAATKKEEQRIVRERRIAFYMSCGCKMTTLRSVLFGVDYHILYLPLQEANNEVSQGAGKGLSQGADKEPLQEAGRGPSKKALDALYRKMFKPAHYAKFVSLTEETEKEAAGVGSD